MVLQFDIRTVQLGALAGSFAAVLIYISRRFTWVWAFVIFILTVCAFVAYVVIKDPYLGSLYDRIHIWKVVLAIWQDNPIFGVSVTGYRDAYREIITAGPLDQYAYVASNGIVYDGMVNGAIEITSHAHNLALMVLSTTGLLGLGAITWLLISFFITSKKDPSAWRKGSVPWMTAFLIIGIAGFNIFDAWYTSLFVFFTVLGSLHNYE
jgi:O-antigen ligase